MKSIPHLDLVRQHAPLHEAILELLEQHVSRAGFVGGPAVAAFEQEFAKACGSSHCIGVANGTDAIKLALRACGVRPGDEVLIPAFTFIASAGAVVDLGAKPLLVDVEEGSALIDPQRVAERLGERTTALLPVHLYGMPCDVPALRRVAGEGRAIVEDAAQAHPARLGAAHVGSLGDAAAFSFYPTKNLSAMGDGGAITTNSPEIAERVRVHADHGRPVNPAHRDDHEELGVNSRLDALQAAVLSLKLTQLPAWQARRRSIAARYREALGGRDELRMQMGPRDAESAWHLFVLRHPERDALMAALLERGIQSRAVYPRALHQYGAMRDAGHGPGDFPQAEAWAAEVFTLPMFPELSDPEVDRVLEAALSSLDEVARAGS